MPYVREGWSPLPPHSRVVLMWDRVDRNQEIIGMTLAEIKAKSVALRKRCYELCLQGKDFAEISGLTGAAIQTVREHIRKAKREAKQ